MSAFMLVVVALTGISSVVNPQLIPFTSNANFREESAAKVQDISSLPVQIEVLLLRFSNPHGVTFNGKKCDFNAWGCDINAFAYIDSEKPYDEWPGQRDIRGSDHFWYDGENSSPTFNKKFTMTICDADKFTAGNLRVNMMDADGFMRGSDDFINNFNCIFTKPKNMTTDALTPFTREMTCDAMYSNPLMQLFFKYRIFRMTSLNNCPPPK